MRKLVVCNLMSLDGYDDGPGQDVMVMPMAEDPEADAHRWVAELKEQPGRGILTFGSRTLWNDLFDGSDNLVLRYRVA